jgi:hypothetical protein
MNTIAMRERVGDIKSEISTIGGSATPTAARELVPIH